LSTRRLWD